MVSYFFQSGLYSDISAGIKHAKVVVACVSSEVSIWIGNIFKFTLFRQIYCGLKNQMIVIQLW